MKSISKSLSHNKLTQFVDNPSFPRSSPRQAIKHCFLLFFFFVQVAAMNSNSVAAFESSSVHSFSLAIMSVKKNYRVGLYSNKTSKMKKKRQRESSLGFSFCLLMLMAKKCCSYHSAAFLLWATWN